LMTALALLALLAAAPDAGDAKLLPRVDGWKLAAPPTKYNAENLFEYIDGGAESFLQFDFQELTSATFVNGKKIEVTVDMYRHRDAVRAFGIYTQERRSGSTKMPGKLEGVAGPDNLQFVAGAYYVKLALSGGGEPSILPMFAEKIAARIPGKKEPPPVLACFPEKGKRPRAEKLTARDFLGHAFLHDAAAVPYEVDDAHFRLFAVEGRDEADVRKMVAAYRAVAKLPSSDVQGEGTVTLKDPLNGEVLLAWSGHWLWGAVDDPSAHRKALVEEIGRNLLRR
jgi:hypothetical protein